MREILTLDEAAHTLGLAVEEVISLANEGMLPASNIGDNWYFTREVITQWIIDSQTQQMLKKLASDEDRKKVRMDKLSREEINQHFGRHHLGSIRGKLTRGYIYNERETNTF